jgi:molybdate transport system substrate-binding protein
MSNARPLLLRLTLAGLLILQWSCTPAGKPDQIGSPTKASPKSTVTLTVFAASSLTEAFTEIGKRFEVENPGVSLSYNFAGSQQLAQQLAQGATADLFASADLEHLQNLEPLGIVSGGSEKAFAQNRLVVIVNRGSPVEVKTLRDLANPGLHLVLAAVSVPVGKYSLEFLEYASHQAEFGTEYKEDVLRNVMSYEENVKAVYSKVLLGEADAGIVYASDLSKLDADRITRLDIPDVINPTALYYIVPLVDSSNPDLAEIYTGYVLSPAGQDILEKYGFIPVN